ncbi:uncharacterized protein F13E9.13, mitochondrial isoform X2 [Bacillus rossius redtenbacheri]|uniref:uncharacterized protein F13E9.13, mitochondrial isoform X2 n=1 Tax=Bacillus rossius redtenbacheri TaxID=93214 RepID=UPI002FDCC92C
MLRLKQIFRDTKCAVIGMIHAGALPGTPLYCGDIQKVLDDACREAECYASSHVDGVMIENMNDIPYVQAKHLGPEITATMTQICCKVRQILQPTPCGVQVLAGGNREAVAVAHAAGLQFVRAEGFVFSHVADEGFTDASAGVLFRYRRNIGANNVLVFTDIKKKHSSHAITSDVGIEDTARSAEFFCSDGVIITGTATGQPAELSELSAVKKVCTGPVLVGSGVTIENVTDYLQADAVIVGTHFKHGGKWQNQVDGNRVKLFMNKMCEARLMAEKI